MSNNNKTAKKNNSRVPVDAVLTSTKKKNNVSSSTTKAKATDNPVAKKATTKATAKPVAKNNRTNSTPVAKAPRGRKETNSFDISSLPRVERNRAEKIKSKIVEVYTTITNARKQLEKLTNDNPLASRILQDVRRVNYNNRNTNRRRNTNK